LYSSPRSAEATFTNEDRMTRTAEELQVGDRIIYGKVNVRVADIHKQEGVGRVFLTLRNIEGKARFVGYVAVNRQSPVEVA